MDKRAREPGVVIIDKSSIDGACLHAYCHEVNFNRLDRAQILASEKCLTVPQIATAYILNQPLNVFALAGAASREEFKANTEACELKLSPQEIAWLDFRNDER